MIFISNLTESGMKIPEGEQTEQHKKMFELSDKLVLELKECDSIIISVYLTFPCRIAISDSSGSIPLNPSFFPVVFINWYGD
jgi:hypothetical protein